MEYKATYNGFELKSADYFISKIDVSSPKTNLNKYELVRADGQVVTNQNFNERIIKVEGKINANSHDEMLNKLDTLKQKLVGIDKNLDVYLGTTTRRYVATVNSFNYTTTGYYCEFTIEFTSNAFGKSFNSNALTFGTYTSNPTTYSNVAEGSYKTKPTINLKFNYVAPYVDYAYLQIYNPSTNQRLRITRKWGNSDLVTIDGENKKITIYPTTVTEIDACDSTTAFTADTGEVLTADTNLRIQGNASIKNTMSSTKASTFTQELNGTSFDLSSSAGYILVPIYIPTPASGTVSSVRLRIGSGATLATNYDDYTVSTQFDGTAIQYSEWNYFKFDLSAAPTTTGTPVRTAIISWQVALLFTTTGRINGWNLDYVSLHKPSITPITADYEGTFPDYEIGTNALVFSDEFSRRSITVTGSYYKRYL